MGDGLHYSAMRPALTRAASSEGRLQANSEQRSYIPYNPPQAREEWDPVDPQWKQLFAELKSMNTYGMSETEKYQLCRARIFPMLRDVRGLPGVAAQEYHEQLAGIAKGLGMNMKIEATQPARFKGMPHLYD